MSVSFLPGHVSGLQTALSTPLPTLNDTANLQWKGSIGDNINSAVVSFVKRLSSSSRFKVQDLYLVHTTQNNVASMV